MFLIVDALLCSNTVTATTSSQEKIDFLLQMPNGATHGVNYKTQDFSEEVAKITGGKGVDVVIDFVGQSHWDKNIASLARDGRMTLVGLLSGSSVPGLRLQVRPADILGL